ncbi:MAG: hypothetical protein AAGA68_10925 [Pseudomonadota bacterium]
MVACATYAIILVLVAIAVTVELAPATPLDRFLRHGWAAGGLGAIYAGVATGAVPAPYRLTFPAIAALLNLLSIQTAVPLASAGVLIGLPFAASLTAASAAWAALFAWVTCAWLRWPVSGLRLIVGAAIGGAGAFGAFAWLRELTSAYAPLTAQLAIYWGLWMTLTTAPLALALRSRGDQLSPAP